MAAIIAQTNDTATPETETGGAPPLSAGAAVAPGYTVLAHLRRGSAFDVYDVWSEERRCRCIAKLLRPERAGDEAARHRLLREGRLLERLSHPHIVRAYETLTRPCPTLILETLTGATLAHLIGERRRPLPVADLAFLGIHLCSAMHYLHHHGFLHLDLKPSNIVSERGLAKVLDFSIARPPGPGRRGEGTRPYMAPEQARGDPLSAATDVWGIGAVLFEAVTGRPPFAAHEGDRYEQLERRAGSVRRCRRLPAGLVALIAACLEPDPTARPAVDELMDGLNALV